MTDKTITAGVEDGTLIACIRGDLIEAKGPEQESGEPEEEAGEPENDDEDDDDDDEDETAEAERPDNRQWGTIGDRLSGMDSFGGRPHERRGRRARGRGVRGARPPHRREQGLPVQGRLRAGSTARAEQPPHSRSCPGPPVFRGDAGDPLCGRGW